MDALVTAGGKTPEALAHLTASPYKCLLELDGHRLIDTVLAALQAAHLVGRICVVGPPELRESLALRPGDLWVDDRGSGNANLMAGLEALADQDQVLFVASDVPFLTAAGLDDLVTRTPAGVGFALPIYRQREVEARLPGATNKYVPFREGDLTASSVMVIGPRLMAQHRDRVELVFGARKHFLKLFAMVGLGTALRFLLAVKLHLRVLDVPSLERRIGRLLGFPVAAVFGADAAFNFDIDHERDWAEALALLESQRHVQA